MSLEHPSVSQSDPPLTGLVWIKEANVMTVKTLTLQRHYPSFLHSKCNLPLALNIDCCTEGIQSLNMIGQRAFSAQISSTLFIDSPNSYVDVCLYSLHSIGSRRVWFSGVDFDPFLLNYSCVWHCCKFVVLWVQLSKMNTWVCLTSVCWVLLSGCEGGDAAGSECEQLQGHVRRAGLWFRCNQAQPWL